MTEADLIAHIESFAGRHGIAPATVTSKAVGNSRLFDLLKAGKSCTLTTAHRIMGYMAEADAAPKDGEAA